MSDELILWSRDLADTILPHGFELGWSGTSAFGIDKEGNLWQVAEVPKTFGTRATDTMWYRFTDSPDHASESFGRMTRQRFYELFGASDDSD